MMNCCRKIALLGASVWDGLQDTLRPATVLIEDRKIAGILPPGAAPEEYEPVSLFGKYIIPGLFEMHGHFYGRATRSMRSQHAAYCPLYLAGGITTVRTPGEFEPFVTLQWKQEIEAGRAIGPRILSACSYFDQQPSIVGWIEGNASEKEIRDKYCAWRDKMDFVKVYSNTPKEWIAMLADMAHRDGLKVYGHLGRCPASDALDAGIDGLEHGFFTMSEFYQSPDPHVQNQSLVSFDPDGPAALAVVEKILEKNAAVTPTTITFMLAGKQYTDRIDAVDGWCYLCAEALEHQRVLRAEWDAQAGEVLLQQELVEKQYRFISHIVHGGGRVFCGTDPSYPLITPGFALVWEAENLVRCGMSSAQILRALTSEAAKEMNVFTVTGSIEAGKEADLCVLNQNPFDSISHLSSVFQVYKGGRAFTPETLRASAVGMMK